MQTLGVAQSRHTYLEPGVLSGPVVVWQVEALHVTDFHHNNYGEDPETPRLRREAEFWSTCLPPDYDIQLGVLYLSVIFY